MTDNEIKALECLCGQALKCKECPYSPRYSFPSCQRQVAKDTIVLITRQQAEIENYKHLDVILHTAIDKLSADIKSEAVKEFAERLKENFGIADCIVTIDNDNIDNLAKEMVGENNG